MNGDDMIFEGGPVPEEPEFYEVWVVMTPAHEPILKRIYHRKSSALASATGHNNSNEQVAEYYDARPDIPNSSMHAEHARSDQWYVSRGTLMIHDD